MELQPCLGAVSQLHVESLCELVRENPRVSKHIDENTMPRYIRSHKKSRASSSDIF